MGELTKMQVKMDPEAWRTLAEKARVEAVQFVAGGASFDRLAKAAELLRAADTFHGHANMMEIVGRTADEAEVMAWDLTDEGFPGEIIPA